MPRAWSAAAYGVAESETFDDDTGLPADDGAGAHEQHGLGYGDRYRHGNRQRHWKFGVLGVGQRELGFVGDGWQQLQLHVGLTLGWGATPMPARRS